MRGWLNRIGGLTKKILVSIVLIPGISTILSYNPVGALTDDTNFGTLEQKGSTVEESRNRIKFRFSLINISLGDKKYFFITWSKGENHKWIFKIKHKLYLREYYISDEKKVEFNQQSSTYKQHLDQISNELEDNICTERDFLLYKIDNENNRITTSTDKLNLYATIILAVIPLVLVFYKIDTFIRGDLVSKIISIILGYCILNVCIYILQITKVSSIALSMFKTVKENSTKKQQEEVASYYFDWKMLGAKADLFVAYVKNIERWIKYSIVTSVVLVGYIQITNYVSPAISAEQYITRYGDVMSIKVNKLDDIYSTDSVLLSKLHYQIRYGNIKSVFIIYRDKTEVTNRIIKEFDIYKDNISISLVKDPAIMDEQIVKFIVEEIEK